MWTGLEASALRVEVLPDLSVAAAHGGPDTECMFINWLRSHSSVNIWLNSCAYSVIVSMCVGV